MMVYIDNLEEFSKNGFWYLKFAVKSGEGFALPHILYSRV